MAKTWKFWPSMFRTQQGISAVSPSHPLRTGLRYVARRVWPAGNCSSPPSDSQSRYPPVRPRATGDMRYRTIGTARIAPTMTLKTRPILTSIPRLDTTVSLLMVVASWCRPRQGSRLLVSGNCGRCAASQATTSEMSCADMGWPGTLLRQSGAPSSGRPTITIVRSC